MADRMMKMLADLTVGTVIVLVHVALADREAARSNRALLTSGVGEPRALSSRLGS